MKKLVLLGAGHAHLKTIHAIPTLLQRGIQVTVVDPSPHLYYSGSVSGIIGGTIAPRGGTIDTRAIVERNGGRFVEAAATKIDQNERTVTRSDGCMLSWDVLSCAIGSHTEPRFGIDAEAARRVIPVKPVRDVALFDRPFIESSGGRPCRIVVVGGGATAVEIAGNMARRVRVRGSSCDVSVLTRSARLLSGFHPAAGKIAETHLAGLGVTVHVNTSVQRVSPEHVVLEDGATIAYDYVIPATGLGVPSVFADSGLPLRRMGRCELTVICRFRGTRFLAVAIASPLFRWHWTGLESTRCTRRRSFLKTRSGRPGRPRPRMMRNAGVVLTAGPYVADSESGRWYGVVHSWRSNPRRQVVAGAERADRLGLRTFRRDAPAPCAGSAAAGNDSHDAIGQLRSGVLPRVLAGDRCQLNHVKTDN